MRGLAPDPNFISFVMFFFPNRDDFFKPVNGEAASLESLGAMGRGDGNSDRNLADFHDSDAMLDGNADDAEALTRLVGELAHLTHRHRLLGPILSPPEHTTR